MGKKINQELKVGDKIKLLYMDGETSVEPGTVGEVKKIDVVFNEKIYSIDWESGSSLGLLDGVDAWIKINPEKITESKMEDDPFYKNVDTFRFFKMKFFKEYLLKLRECGVTNMLGAAPYLYMGRDRMEIDFNYHNVENEICDDVLDLSDKAQHEMINGTIKYLEEKNKEDNLENINRQIRRFATSIVVLYANLV